MTAQVTHIAGRLGIIVDRLEGVRRSGRGYIARCPAHTDRSPSLSLAEGENGAVLLHCFGGCAPAQVLGAIGLQLGDLFPERLRPATPQERREALRLAREQKWAAALETIAFETLIVVAAADHIRRGQVLDAENRARLQRAEELLNAARESLRVR